MLSMTTLCSEAYVPPTSIGVFGCHRWVYFIVVQLTIFQCLCCSVSTSKPNESHRLLSEEKLRVLATRKGKKTTRRRENVIFWMSDQENI